jgi:hypothetical protein
MAKAAPSLTKRQIERWTDLCDTISRNHGAVVSPPHEMRIRFHVQADNPLPDLLRDCGHSVIPSGITEALWPVTEAGTGIQNVRPCMVHVFELEVEK